MARECRIKQLEIFDKIQNNKILTRAKKEIFVRKLGHPGRRLGA